MKLPTIHKLIRGNFFYYPACETDGVDPEKTSYRWKKVTCKRCLSRKGKK
jgi:hypothetical protein